MHSMLRLIKTNTRAKVQKTRPIQVQNRPKILEKIMLILRIFKNRYFTMYYSSQKSLQQAVPKNYYEMPGFLGFQSRVILNMMIWGFLAEGEVQEAFFNYVDKERHLGRWYWIDILQWKKMERFGQILTQEIDLESQKLALFDLLIQSIHMSMYQKTFKVKECHLSLKLLKSS